MGIAQSPEAAVGPPTIRVDVAARKHVTAHDPFQDRTRALPAHLQTDVAVRIHHPYHPHAPRYPAAVVFAAADQGLVHLDHHSGPAYPPAHLLALADVFDDPLPQAGIPAGHSLVARLLVLLPEDTGFARLPVPERFCKAVNEHHSSAQAQARAFEDRAFKHRLVVLTLTTTPGE